MELSSETSQNTSILTEETPDSNVDEINYELFLRIYIPSFIYTIIMMLICCFGNMMVIYVYLNRPRNSAARDYIIALAVFDLINGFITMPTELAIMWNIFRWQSATICKLSRFLTFLMNFSSSLTLLFMAIDRYRRLCKPQNIPFNTRKNVSLICLGVAVSIILTWPAILIFGIQTIKYPVPENVRTVVGSTCLISDGFKKSVYPLIFNVIILSLTVLFDIVFVSIYIFIAIKIKKQIDFEQNLDPRMVRSLVMLFLVTLLFMVSFLPYCIIGVIRFINQTYYAELSTPGKAIYQFFFRSYILSMALNPVIYSFMSKQFREESNSALTKLCKKY